MVSPLKPGHTKHGRKATITPYAPAVPDEKQKRLENAGDDSEDAALSRIDPPPDLADPMPFEQKPPVLAALLDLKSLLSLEAVGSSEGLLCSLGTDTDLGLRSWQFTDLGWRNGPEGGNGGGAGPAGESPTTQASVDKVLECQFRKLNDKKEDRGVKVVCDGKEQVIDVKDVLISDIALLETSEIVPCDGVFLREHN
ncbi:hypothetical protein FRC06_008556, partial [Ceratobasidium sp. 370]